jgi:hypothetical protein
MEKDKVDGVFLDVIRARDCNADTFADGSSDPFGAAAAGTATLSVFGRYVVGQ